MYDIIINPASKAGHGKGIWDRVQQELEHRKVEYQAHFTSAPGDATGITEEIMNSDREAYYIIIIGGDGTLNEAINGIQDFSKVKIGYIPAGSSNDFSRAVHIERNPVKAISNILDVGHTKEIDIGVASYRDCTKHNIMTERKFCVSSGIGFDAAVCEEALHSKVKDVLNKLHMGKLTYLMIAIRQVLTGPAIPCTITLDNEREIYLEKFLFVASMIQPYEGGGFMFCPHADCTDGMVETCVVGAISKPKMFRILPTAYKGNHLKFKNIDEYHSKTVSVHLEAPIWLHTDGEIPAKTDQVSFICQEQKMNLFCE